MERENDVSEHHVECLLHKIFEFCSLYLCCLNYTLRICLALISANASLYLDDAFLYQL